jgi:hypothetical protein
MMRMEIPCFVHGNMENGSSHWGVIFECLDSTPSIGSEFNGLWVASPSYWKNQHHSHDRTWVCLCHWLGPTMTQYFAGNSHNSIYIYIIYVHSHMMSHCQTFACEQQTASQWFVWILQNSPKRPERSIGRPRGTPDASRTKLADFFPKEPKEVMLP